MSSELDNLFRLKANALVFLPNTNELQRFVLAGAFVLLERRYVLHYVVPAGERERMQAAAPGVLTPSNTSELHIPPERFEQWRTLFDAACVRFADRSPSFAIRAGVPLAAAAVSAVPGAEPSSPSAVAGTLKALRRWLPGGSGGEVPPPAPDPAAAAAAAPAPAPAPMVVDYEALVSATLDRMQPLPAILDLFERFNPLLCIVPTSLLDLFCNDVARACQKARVSVALLQSGWDNLSSKGVLHAPKPFLGCWGPQSSRHGKLIQGLRNAFLHDLGAPHYEFLVPAAPDDVRAMRAALGADSWERLILFGGSFRQFDETSTLRRLEMAIRDGRLPGVRIVYRPHPWRAARKYEDDFFQHEWKHVVFDPDMRERYVQERREAGYIKRHVPMYDMSYLARLLSSVDAVISPMSTLLLESMILDRPTMAIAFGDGKHRYDPSVTSQMTHFAELKASPALLWCDDERRLLDDCASLLAPETAARMAGHRAELLAEVVVRGPGTYAERLARFCEDVVEPQALTLRQKRHGMRRQTISHAYGAQEIAAAYCDAPAEEVEVPGYWMHGWIPAYHNLDPALIALHKRPGQKHGGDYDYPAQIREEKASTLQLVSRQDQADYLTANGYQHVKAIGLPIVYLPRPQIRRVPGSLLVLPPHGHKTHGPDDRLADEYASVIAGLKSRFSHIRVGLTEDDFVKDEWVSSFREYGLEVVMTAQQSDGQTLRRLVDILSTFEYVTSNGFGSQIAYAAYCGAKVSVYGPYATFPRGRMTQAHAVAMFPELLDKALYVVNEDGVRQHYPFLFVEPDEATLHEEWGAAEVGAAFRLAPREMAQLFGWESQVVTA